MSYPATPESGDFIDDLGDIEIEIPDIDPDAPEPEVRCAVSGPFTVYDVGDVPITQITGNISGLTGEQVSQHIMAGIEMLGMSDTYESVLPE